MCYCKDMQHMLKWNNGQRDHLPNLHHKRLLKPIKSTWKEKWVSMVSHGLRDSQKRLLINFMAISQEGSIFLQVDVSDIIISKHYIADKMVEVIKEMKSGTFEEFILNDLWWDKIAYNVEFTKLIYNVFRACDTYNPTLHLVYEM
ncbi:hypothetical protein L6164_037571 [Bauhinia variegata]|uniref:Uncharacterized protein n=1 Tax=Bauhinia variegata TaxID=167791 RepID=A0ACB9KKL3_BAUVA|nr:hypothetical protein L6164_037571 [Bauhinia variegata]